MADELTTYNGRTLRVLASSADRPVWLAARKTVVTASEVASILGFGYSTRNLLKAVKRSEKEEGDCGDLAMVAAGRHIEPAIAAWFAEETLGELEPCGFLLQDACHSYLGATPDFTLDRREPVECKLVSFEAGYNWHRDSTPWPTTRCFPFTFSDLTLAAPLNVVPRFAPFNRQVSAKDVGTPKGGWRQGCVDLHEQLTGMGPLCAPLKFWVQLQVQMHVLGASSGWMVACIGGTNRVDFRYAYDARFMEHAMGEVARFWEEVSHVR